jgi:hypothetical protein
VHLVVNYDRASAHTCHPICAIVAACLLAPGHTHGVHVVEHGRTFCPAPMAIMFRINQLPTIFCHTAHGRPFNIVIHIFTHFWGVGGSRRPAAVVACASLDMLSTVYYLGNIVFFSPLKTICQEQFARYKLNSHRNVMTIIR